MNFNKLKLPIIFFSIGLIVSIICCMLTSILKKPTVIEHDFHYSITYKLDGETKTFKGVYNCRFEDFEDGMVRPNRYYVGEHMDYGLAVHTTAYTIAQKDEFDLGIVMDFNNSYLMGDTKNDYYDDTVLEPYLIVCDQQGVVYTDTEKLSMFDAEIISWEHPEPIENTFVFVGFSPLHEISLLIMLLISFMVLLACLIFVRKDADVTYRLLDTIGVVLNFVCIFVVFPIITMLVWLFQAYSFGPDWINQLYCCIPAAVILSLAASISLRRKGFAKIGFFAQFIGSGIFALIFALECLGSYVL